MTDGIEKLIEEIELQSAGERERILQQADEEIRVYGESFENKKKELLHSSEKAFEREGELRRRQIVTSARMEIRKAALSVKSQAVNGVFDLAMERLWSLRGKARARLMEILLESAVVTASEEVLPGSSEEAVNRGLVDRLNSEKGWKLKYAEKTERITGGFILRSDDFETVVGPEAVREFLVEKYESRVTAELFESEDDRAPGKK